MLYFTSIDQKSIYHAALNAGRSSGEKGVCPFVCLSAVKCVDCDKTEEKFVHIFVLYERYFA